jgi:hypothetical protein
MSFHAGNINQSNPLFISLYGDKNEKEEKNNKFNLFGSKIKTNQNKEKQN